MDVDTVILASSLKNLVKRLQCKGLNRNFRLITGWANQQNPWLMPSEQLEVNRPDFNSYLNHFEKSVIQDQEMNKKVMKEYLEIVK